MSNTMRGRQYSDNRMLPENDLVELSDLLALRVHHRLGDRAFRLNRGDIAELISPYISDLVRDDQRAIVWLIWELFQEGREIALQAA